MTTRLNQFTGMSTEALIKKLKTLNKTCEELERDDGFEGGVSPRESLYGQIDDLQAEIDRRVQELLNDNKTNPPKK